LGYQQPGRGKNKEPESWVYQKEETESGKGKNRLHLFPKGDVKDLYQQSPDAVSPLEKEADLLQNTNRLEGGKKEAGGQINPKHGMMKGGRAEIVLGESEGYSPQGWKTEGRTSNNVRGNTGVGVKENCPLPYNNAYGRFM